MSEYNKSNPSRDPITDAHRLCHNVHGPHNQQFHALWNQLRDEHQELIFKGYTGEGFLSDGRRLGGRAVPVDEARRLARAAAEQRKALSAGSGRKLGGTPLLRGTDMRRVIADAAQRRIEVTRGCASGTDQSAELAEEASRNGFRTKAEEDDANEQAIMQAYIELIQQEEREKYGPSYIPPSQENPAGPRSTLSPPPVPPPVPESTRPTLQPPDPTPDPIDLTSDDASYDQPWTCPTCTLENPPNFLCCDACTSERPQPSNPRSISGPAAAPGQSRSRSANKRPISQDTNPIASRQRRAAETLAAIDKTSKKRPLGWVCHACGTFMETEYWTCSSCGMMKQTS